MKPETILKSFMISIIVFMSSLNNLYSQKKEDAGAAYSVFKGTLADMSWPEVKKAADTNALVLVPIGVIEEHGPHMSLGVDTYLAIQRCLALKKDLDSMGIPVVIAPPVYWGVMQLSETGAFPGSFMVSPGTMKALLTDIFADLQRWGFHYVYCVNHHGDRVHRRTLVEAISDAETNLGLAFYNDREGEDRDHAPDDKQFISGEIYEPNFHAGTSETSAMLAYYPELVNAAQADTLKPENWFQPLGYVGDPASYKKIDMEGLDSLEAEYYAACIAGWLEQMKNDE